MTQNFSDKRQLTIIAANLKTLLDSKDLTQVELAKILGVSESAVGKWMLGHNAPSMGNIQRIADYFGVPKSRILDEDFAEELTTEPFASKRHKVLFDRIKNASEDDLQKLEKILDLIEAEQERNGDF